MVSIIPVDLGKDLTYGHNTIMRIGKEGVCVVLGRTGTGKSAIVKNISIAASKQRQVIVFSYGDEYNQMVYANSYSTEPDCMDKSNTLLVKGVKFKVSDFGTDMYWKYLGIPQGASRFLASIAKNIEMHHESPELFFEIISRTKTTMKSTNDDNVLHEASKISIMSNKDFLLSMLDYDVIDWKKVILSGKNIIVDLCLNKEDHAKAQFIVGAILHKIKPYILFKKPILVFEEADILLEPVLPFPFSYDEIVDYNLKMQKAGIFMILVAQQEYRFPRTITDNATKFIYGSMNVQGDDYLSKLINSIRWQPSIGIREFVFYDQWSNCISKFCPKDVACYIDRRF